MKKLLVFFLAMYILLLLVGTACGDEKHVSRGKLLQSLSKYDDHNSKVYKEFIRSRNSGGVVGFQPYITILPQGTSLNAFGIVSGDRRYVRLTINPFFSVIGSVDTFTFAR